MTHGNYKLITHLDAYETAKSRDGVLVTLDTVVHRGSVALHIVGPHDFYTKDTPEAYAVELHRPMWLYGNEGMLSPALEFLGRLEDDWLDACESDWWPGDDYDPFPDHGDFLWLLPNSMYPSTGDSPWRTVDWDWYATFRNPPQRIKLS